MEEVVFLKENIVKSRQNDKTGKNAIKLIKVEIFQTDCNQKLH